MSHQLPRARTVCVLEAVPLHCNDFGMEWKFGLCSLFPQQHDEDVILHEANQNYDPNPSLLRCVTLLPSIHSRRGEN